MFIVAQRQLAFKENNLWIVVSQHADTYWYVCLCLLMHALVLCSNMRCLHGTLPSVNPINKLHTVTLLMLMQQ